MPERSAFEAAIIRLVPRPEREEFLNVGVIIFSPPHRFLEARYTLDEARVQALAPGLVDLEEVREHLEHLRRVAAGDPAAGPLSQLSQAERFHWLVAPRSTVIQVSPAHSGLCSDPARALEQLMDKMVRLPKAEAM